MSAAAYVMAFESTHAAMAAYHALSGVTAAMVPTPKHVSAGCGISLRFEAEGEDAAVLLAGRISRVAGLASLYEESNGRYRPVEMG